jgi:N-acetylmuramoyl-L-alanine amidase
MTRLARSWTRAAALLLALGLAHAANAGEPIRLRVELGGTIAAPSWFALTGPDRLVVDLPGGRAEASRTPGRGAVRRVRLAQLDRATARVVIELAAPARIERADSDPEGGAVMLVLAPTTPQDFARLLRMGRFSAVPPVPTPATPPRAATAQANADVLAALDDTLPAASPRAERPLIVVDPGHGGHDAGAVSVYEGRFEKDATLAIAHAIAREIERSGRFRVALTREDDRFIELGERVAIARRAGASLFVSIHCDSASNADAHGATVYTLSDVASDRMAARAAARENMVDAAGSRIRASADPDVATILYDLTRRSAMNGSATFAETLERAMPGDVAFTGNYHRFAGFRVLKTADMLAALLETGYVTNVEDAHFLFSPEGQRAIARGVRAAVERYFTPRVANVARGGVEGRGGTR